MLLSTFCLDEVGDYFRAHHLASVIRLYLKNMKRYKEILASTAYANIYYYKYNSLV